GVGASIAAKIAEYRETGSIRALDELRAKIPSGVLELTRVPGLGPKRALQLNRDLGVQSVDDLAAAIKAGRLDGLAGFGAKSEERIAAGIEVYRQGRERVLLDVALRTANEMVDALTPISQRCAYAGSLRRWRETIGDIDILAAADDSGPLMAAFSAWHDVVASGPTKTTVSTASGLIDDLRGDLHTHTDLTDGVASLETMVTAARRRGYEYYAVTDHAPDLIMQRMTDEKMLAQREQVRALTAQFTGGLALLHGTELNI